MKKIAFACDGKNFSPGSIEFINWMQQQEPVLVTGVFFSSVNYEMLIATSIAGDAGAYLNYNAETAEEIASSVRTFETHCQKACMTYRVHQENKSWNPEDIRKETRFADLLVISAEKFCADINSNQPNSYMRQVLHNAECPIVLVPENFRVPERLLFAYDGRKESMFALKQFSYLFPGMSSTETDIVYMQEDQNDHIPDLSYLEEYAGCHFDNLNFMKQHFNPRKYFATWTAENDNIILISGAYSRTGISELLEKSFAEDVIRNHRFPVFIAHTV